MTTDNRRSTPVTTDTMNDDEYLCPVCGTADRPWWAIRLPVVDS